MNPLAPNCREHKLDEHGKVVGIHLQHIPMSDTPYVLHSCKMLDEYEADNRHVARISVYEADGITPVLMPVKMAWPFDGGLDNFTNSAIKFVGADTGYADHVLSSAFSPPNLGPYAIWVGSEIHSDVLASLGLPYGRHIVIEAEFRRRGGNTQPPQPPPYTDLLPHIQSIRSSVAEMERIITGGGT